VVKIVPPRAKGEFEISTNVSADATSKAMESHMTSTSAEMN
jgi:hypothetical protein